MRQILFRGKSLRNGKWCYGSLVQSKYCEWIFESATISQRVDPKTTSISVGYTYPTCEPIFEGDIVRVTHSVNKRPKDLPKGGIKV